MVAALLLAVVALLFSPTLSFPFLQLDDNPRLLQQDLANRGIGWAFGNPFAWQPLTWLSHSYDFRNFGFQDARNHHLVNLLLHLTNTGLFLWLLSRLTQQLGVSFAAGALFALHPLRVESVAWVSARGDLLATLFVLLALEAHRRKLWYAVVPLGALAMLASPAAAPIGLLILLLDRFVLTRVPEWREVGPLLALGVAALAMRATGGPDHDTLLPTAPVVSITQGFATLAGQVISTFFPVNLTIARMPGTHLGLAGAGGAIFALMAGWMRMTSQPMVAFGTAWFLLTLAPSLLLPTVWGRTDSQSYLPHLGLMTALVFAVPMAWRAIAGKAVVALLLVCAALSWGHLNHFRGTIPLLERAVSLERANPETHLALGFALAGQGAAVDAEKHLQLVTQARPDSGLAWAGYGRVLTAQKRPTDALTVLDNAIRQAPKSADVRFERGIALQNLRRMPEAEQDFILALNLGLDARSGAIAYNNLGTYAAQRNELAKAEKYFQQAFTLDLGFALAHRNYAMALVAQKQRDQAIAHLKNKAVLWTNNDRLVGEYLAALITEAYQEQYKKEQELIAIEKEVERKALEQRLRQK